MCRGISEIYDGEIEISGDTNPTSGKGQMRRGIRETHGGESQTAGDTSPFAVGQDKMRRGIRESANMTCYTQIGCSAFYYSRQRARGFTLQNLHFLSFLIERTRCSLGRFEASISGVFTLAVILQWRNRILRTSNDQCQGVSQSICWVLLSEPRGSAFYEPRGHSPGGMCKPKVVLRGLLLGHHSSSSDSLK